MGGYRRRTSFIPNRTAERRQIAEEHRDGRVYLGDWHTHPESFPRASRTDIASVGEIARGSRHLAGPVVLVVADRTPVAYSTMTCSGEIVP